MRCLVIEGEDALGDGRADGDLPTHLPKGTVSPVPEAASDPERTFGAYKRLVGSDPRNDSPPMG